MNHDDHNREELFTDPEELLTFAQAYYATEFPKDEQRDCLPVEALRKAAHTGAPPDESLRSHLFSCSDCFRTYRSARMTRQVQAAPAGWWRERLGARFAGRGSSWMPVAAGVFSLILLGLVTATLLRRPRTDSTAVVMSYSLRVTPPATPSSSDNGSVPVEPLQESGRPVAERQVTRPAARVSKPAAGSTRQPQLALRVVYVDLKEDDLVRGDSERGDGSRIITLAPERQRLRLRLPRGSVAGRYTVKVVDAYGKPLLTTAARTGGRMLTVEIDLRGLDAKLYRLCLSRDGEAPDCYLMSVSSNPAVP